MVYPAKSSCSRGMRTVLRRRERDCSGLDEQVVLEILTKGLSLTPGVLIPERSKQPHAKVVWLLYHHLCVSSDEHAGWMTRKNSLLVARLLIASIDRAVAERNATTHSEKEIDPKSSLPRGDSSIENLKNISAVSSTNDASSVDRRLEPANGKSSMRASAGDGQQEMIAAPSATHQEPTSTRKDSQMQDFGKGGPDSSRNQTAAQVSAPGRRNKKTNGTFSLSSFCEANNAYTETDSAKSRALTSQQSVKVTNGRSMQQAASNTRPPPPYEKRSQNLGAIRASSSHRNVTSEDRGKEIPRTHKKGSSSISEAERQKRTEEKRRKRTEMERKKRAEVEQKKQVEEKAEAERKKRVEEERRKQAEAERKKHVEEERRKQARNRAEEERRRSEIAAVLKSGIKPGNMRAQSVQFPKDTKPIKSNALDERPALTVRYTPRALTEEQAQNLSSRLARWDPYWQVSQYVACGVTSLVENKTIDTQVTMVAECSFSIKQSHIQDMKATDWGVKPVSRDAIGGRTRLIMRMIPVIPTDKGRADSHLWPKGSFIVVNGSVVSVDQRKQQAHDPKKWLGLSSLLDLTCHIQNPAAINKVKLCSYDDQLFFYCIALCKYNPPSTLFKNFVSQENQTDCCFERLSREESIAKAKTFTKQAAVTIDESDNETGLQDEEPGKLVFTLTCPFSKSIMVKPVRGKNCSHFQCFDLRLFLESNALVHGQNWRCLVCEKYISYRDLQLCGLTEDLILEFSKELIPTEKDRIEYCSDGSYILLQARKQRYGKKRAVPEVSKSAMTAKSNPTESEPEIILLD